MRTRQRMTFIVINTLTTPKIWESVEQKIHQTVFFAVTKQKRKNSGLGTRLPLNSTMHITELTTDINIVVTHTSLCSRH